MTVSVSPYFRDAENNIEWLNMPEGFNELVGSEKLKICALSVLPSLVDANIFAEGSELVALEKDVDLLLSKLSIICNRKDTEYWKFRLLNIRTVIDVAKENNGGVCIQ